MKYVLFNIAVATALVFLFTADRGEVQRIAGRAHDVAGDVKAYADKAFSTGRSLLARQAVNNERQTDPAPVAAPAKPVPAPTPKPAAPTATRPALPPTTTPPAVTPPAPSRTPPAARRRLAGNFPAVPETEPKVAAPSLAAAPSADLDPDVAKRRREVLQGIDTTAAAAPVLKEGTRLMTPSERRRELLSLAEEMELLYARSVSR